MENGTASLEMPPLPPGDCAPRAEKRSDAELLKRFVEQRDETAFAAIVRRHGPMVLGACRRVLHDWHAAEDAFQATFLVLARRARSIARPDLLGNWLYGVAYRTAVRAKANAARRNAYERQAMPMLTAEPTQEVAWREVMAVLDEEMNRLPEKYRAPLVLCYLEGCTNEEAARQLGHPTGSMSGLLSRGRELLRKRLTRRGVLVSAGLLALLLSPGQASAALPQALVESTVRSALIYSAAKAALPAGVTRRAAELANQMLHAMLASWLKRVALVVVTFASMTTAGSVLAYESLATTPPAVSSTTPTTPVDCTTTSSETTPQPSGGPPMDPCRMMKSGFMP